MSRYRADDVNDAVMHSAERDTVDVSK